MKFTLSSVAISSLLVLLSPSSTLAFTPSSHAVNRISPTVLYSSKEPGHDVSRAMGDLSDEEKEAMQKKQMAFQEHQMAAPKLDWPTEIRTLVEYNHGYAVMSTNSKAEPGYASGSVVGFVPDEETGEPMFLFSGMSSHTQDILENPKCSLTVAAKEFKGAADGRVNLMGTCALIKSDEDKAKARELYLAKHPNSAVWIDFGDFHWYKLSVEKIRFVGGFARAGSVSADEYKAATPDPISQFSGPVAKHMNDDHTDAIIAMAKTVPGVGEDKLIDAQIVSMDSLGMYIKVEREVGVPKQFKFRLPFPRAAENRGDVKVLIMELTQAAAATATSEK